MTPKLWTKLVDDAVHRHMSRWRLGEIAAVIREADTAWATQVETTDAELIKYIDMYIFMERDRDQCARERDAYKAERDALLGVARAAQEAIEPGCTCDSCNLLRDALAGLGIASD
jgi:hypothetical protein